MVWVPVESKMLLAKASQAYALLCRAEALQISSECLHLGWLTHWRLAFRKLPGAQPSPYCFPLDL